ncbi:MAG: phospholipid/cholesterol/gamma-HCH transport system substrate-binding protein [Methyloprofundus sp.]|nr:MAG: phospholipid/cholesterol/gamma-HCH transport system substrate-binding protein [Methyloprofundus sp.]
MSKDSFALVTGLFMATLIVGVVIIIIWLGGVQHQSKTYIAETSASVTGLKNGSTVYYRGIEAGKVSAIGFDPEDPKLIIVSMKIDKDIQFTRGIYAMLEMKGVTGLTQIALKDSGETPGLLPNSERIPIKPSFIKRISVSGEEMIKQTHELMTRLSRLLNDKNTQHVQQILVNVETATRKFNHLQDSAEKTLSRVPVLTADAHHSLLKINRLTDEFTLLSQQLRTELSTLSKQSGDFMQTGTAVGQQLLQTSLPKINTLIMQLQATTRRFDRVGTMMETEPQMFLFGAEPLQPAPGEPGFKEAQ